FFFVLTWQFINATRITFLSAHLQMKLRKWNLALEKKFKRIPKNHFMTKSDLFVYKIIIIKLQSLHLKLQKIIKSRIRVYLKGQS
ncbi:hypothetical protein DERP_006577, partial [Dermatophagoides pteronyssinus]